MSFLKKNLVLLFVLFCITPVAHSATEGVGDAMLDYDFKYIDNPFGGQKIISDKEFDNVVNSYKQKSKPRKGFWNWVFEHTLPKDMIKENNSESVNQLPYEIKYQKDMVATKPTLALGAEIYDYNGNVIHPGYYQIAFKDGYLRLIQGFNTVGTLKAKITKDDWGEQKIIYARTVNINEDFIKIIYSDIDNCYEATVQIKPY